MTLSQCLMKLGQKYNRRLTEEEIEIATFAYGVEHSEVPFMTFTVCGYSKFNPNIVRYVTRLGENIGQVRSSLEEDLNRNFPEHKWGIAGYRNISDPNETGWHCMMHPVGQTCDYCRDLPCKDIEEQDI